MGPDSLIAPLGSVVPGLGWLALILFFCIIAFGGFYNVLPPG